jgi:hypothetical protein
MAKEKSLRKTLLEIIKDWDYADQNKATLSELQSYYEDRNIQALSFEELKEQGSFLPNSLVMACEDDPNDLCFYTEDGIHLTPIFMIDSTRRKIDPKDVLTEDDAEEEGYEYYDFETFMDHYDGYENMLINFKNNIQMATKAKSTKALDLLKSNKTVSERAENYIVSVKRNIQRDVIDSLTAKKEAMEDELFELTNFNLETDMNKGFQQMTKESVEARFKKIIDLEYKLKLTDLELSAKQTSFNKYFEDAE